MKRLMIVIMLLALCLVHAAAEEPGIIGDGDTESAVLTEIPKDLPTVAFPVSAVTTIRVENGNSRPVAFRVEGNPEPQMAYVVPDDTAILRMEASAADNPAGMICCDYNRNISLPLPELLDPERGAFLYSVAMPDAGAECHYAHVGLLAGGAGEGEALSDVYLISDDAYIGELAEDMKSRGYTVTWEYAGSVPAEAAAPEAYILYITDQDGAPVPGVTVKFCTDTNCTLVQADGNGIVTFAGAPEDYHMQVLKVPAGYSFDADYELSTGSGYGEWLLRIRKNQETAQ